MGKKAAKSSGAYDVVVVGDHPSASLAAALLSNKNIRRIGLIPMRGALPEDRLVTLNPALFDLHPMLAPLQAAIPSDPVHGVRFLSNEPGIHGEHFVDKPSIFVAKYTDVRSAFATLTELPGIELMRGDGLQVERIDAGGLDLSTSRGPLRTKAIVFAEMPDRETDAVLAMADHWEPGVLRRFTMLRCKTEKHLNLHRPRTMPLSLEVGSSSAWGRLLVGGGGMMLAVDAWLSDERGGKQLLDCWIATLKRHHILDSAFSHPPGFPVTVDLPLAGALSRECVASRSLLIGPAGGFYSQCGEEIYPGCWSAVFAVETLVKALKEPHLQDALQSYRQKWPVTLGEYLRGPQENLRFLLPMVYKNQAMATRMAEAFMLSLPVVR
jgi:hypothetical protein